MTRHSMLLKSVILGVLLIGLAAGITLVVGLGPDSAKPPLPPDPISSRPPDEQFAASKAADQERANDQAAFRAEFARSGRDFHTLPTRNIATTTVGTESLAGSVQNSTSIVRATVLAQRLAPNGGSVISELRVSGWLLGSARAGAISVRQVGAPTMNGTEAVLTQMSSDPILWKGREYILFIKACTNPEWVNDNCIFGNGRQFEISGQAVTSVDEAGWAAAVRAVSIDTFTQKIGAAR